MRGFIDITGKKFGTLTVLSRSGASYAAKWLCKCDCGVERVYLSTHIRTLSAKCYCSGGKDRIGATKDPLYHIWGGMKMRCNGKRYINYHGRGITVSPLWAKDFPAFRDWALSAGWAQGLEIDRIDNDSGYSPENCRFVTPSQNCRNKRNNVRLTFNGESRLIVEWSEVLGIPEKTIQNRLRYGWTHDRTLSTPRMTVKEANQHRSIRS